MKKGVKIALAVGIPTVLFGAYFFGYRNRRPKLSFERIDYLKERGVVKFGSVTNDFSKNRSFTQEAGNSYSDKYTLSVTPKGDKTIFEVYRHNGDMSKLIEKIIIDYSANLKYSEGV